MPDGANGRGGTRGATAQRCALLLALGLLAACAARQATVTPPPAVPPAAPPLEQPVFSQSGLASLYGSNFQGKRTASGEPLNNSAMTAAHRSLPFGSEVSLTIPAPCTLALHMRSPSRVERRFDRTRLE